MTVLVLNANFPTSSGYEPDLYEVFGSNSGNGYITHACSRLFGLTPETAILHPATGVPERRPGQLAEAAAGATHILYVMQDQLRADTPDGWYEHSLRLLRSLESVSAPLTVVSLAANSFGGYDHELHQKLSPVKSDFFKYLAERAGSLGVRGEYTAAVLERLGVSNFEVVGCPSYFEVGPDRWVQAADPARVADQRLGLTGAVDLPRLGDRTLRFLQGDFEWPFSLQMLTPNPFWRHDPAVMWSAYGDPSRAAVALSNAQGRSRFYTDYPAWKDELRQHCFAAVGSRLHGAIIALNAGVPAAVTNSDSRAAETCRLFGIPWYPHGFSPETTPEEVAEACHVEDLNARYRPCYDAFAAWAAKQGLTVNDRPAAGLLPPPLRALPREAQVTRTVEAMMEDLRYLAPKFAQACIDHEAMLRR